MEDLAHEKEKSLEEELRRLRALVSSFELLNSSLDLDTVLDYTLTQAVQLLGAEVGSIALLNEVKSHLLFVKSTDPNFNVLKGLLVPLDKGISGYVARTGESVRVEDTSRDNRFYQDVDEKLHHTTRTYLCVPLIFDSSVIGTAQLMNRLDGKPFSAGDEGLFRGFARQAALAIQNARVHSVMLKQQAMDSELRVCNEIQMNLYPKKLPGLHNFEVYGVTVPCREVGGDYYTFVERPDGSVDAVIADVSGKGVSAAMLVSELHTGVQLLSRMDQPLADFANHLNSHLVETIIMGKFITFFTARLKPEDSSFEYVNAGHPPPYIVRSNGSIEELETTGTILGIQGMNAIDYRTNRLEQGDLLVAFSDAYSESMDKEGDLFGEMRIATEALSKKESSLSEIADHINRMVMDFREGLPAADDATLLLIRHI